MRKTYLLINLLFFACCTVQANSVHFYIEDLVIPGVYRHAGDDGMSRRLFTYGATIQITASNKASFDPVDTSDQNIQFNGRGKSATTPLTTMGAGVQPIPKLSLAVFNSYGVMDNITIRIDAGAGDSSSDRYDALKWTNTNFDLYSIGADGHKLSIDARGNRVTIIPLGIKTGLTANNFFLKVLSMDGLGDKKVVLRDKLLHTETQLQAINDSYGFNITADTSTKGDNRFELVFNSAAPRANITTMENSVVNVLVSPNPVRDILTIHLGKESVSPTAVTHVRVMSLDGKILQADQAAMGVSIIKLALGNYSRGVLMIEVQNDKINSIQKVVKE